MTSPASRRAALLAHLSDLIAAYRELAGLPLPDESSDAGAGGWFDACDRIMARADRAGERFAIEKREYAKAVGAAGFTYGALLPIDPDLAETVAARAAEATDLLKRQEARLASMGSLLSRFRERAQGQVGKYTNGRKVRAAYHPPETPEPLLFDRKE